MDAKLREIGERGAIRRLAALVGARPDVAVGIGDDCAVVTVEGSRYDWLLTTDPVIEGVHFLPDAPPEGIGHKAAGRVLSDIAAGGGEPLWLLFDVVAPRDMPISRLEAVYRGATALCGRHGAVIVGGDLAQGERLELHAFAVGRVPRGQAALRSGARPGDAVYVTGRLGGSLRGRHLAFEPRVAEGRWLAERRWVSAMMDVSDGLAADLRRIFEQSGVGAEIELDRVPLSEDAHAMEDDLPPVAHALCDGEDFELLFTVRPDRAADFEPVWAKQFPLPCARIGQVTANVGELRVVDAAGKSEIFEGNGYEHFRNRTALDLG